MPLRPARLANLHLVHVFGLLERRPERILDMGMSGGWWPDPRGAPVERWHDGRVWTQYTRPMPVMIASNHPVSSDPAGRVVAILVALVIGVALVVAIFSSLLREVGGGLDPGRVEDLLDSAGVPCHARIHGCG